jgi:hypothetical protein
MNLGKKSTPPQITMPSHETAREFAARTRRGIAGKANHNKTEAMGCLVISLGSTLLAPLFITLGEGVFWGKAIPATLAAVATFCTAWLQLRKPQQLWSLYRGAQREIEDEETKHEFKIADYSDATDPDKLLAERVANIALTLHQKWAPLVPNPENLRTPALPDKTTPTATGT